MIYYIYLIYFIYLLVQPINSSLINKKTNNPVINNEIKKVINLELGLKDKKIIEKIKGFYGLIGPNFGMENNLDNLYDLFIGDGVIQGVFFDKGKITFIKHVIKTEKLKYEEKNGKLIDNFLIRIIVIFLNDINLFPNMLGTANTAIINIKKNNTKFNNEYLKHRISCVPIHKDNDSEFENMKN